MTRFADQPLFDPGLDVVSIGPLAARHAVTAATAGHGAAVLSQGIEPRTIEHAGLLTADTTAALHARVAAIEAYLDAGSHPLQLDDGRTLSGCTLVSAAFEPAVALGPRVACRYRLAYLQPSPLPGGGA
jgi:hypothetical protein